MSNELTTPKQKLLELFEGIFLGRTLHDLEKQAGAPIEALLKAVRDDEQAFLDFKAARSWGTYVQESEIRTLLRDNALTPESAIKTNALKLYADHLHWALERANPAEFSGKVQVSATVPVQIITTLDLPGAKQIDGIYELAAEVPSQPEEREIGSFNDHELQLLEASAVGSPPSSPFDAAVSAILEGDRLESASARLEALLDADARSLEEEISEQVSAAAPQVAEAAPRPQPRRKRRVVREEQTLVERGTPETKS